jgi:2,5-furandicarboxylate decarboxylase 1
MDLRALVDLLSREGLLRRVERQVDWKYELGEIARTNQAPLLFENIKDYPGQRLFTNGMSSLESMALALGIGREKRRRRIVKEAKKRAANPIKPQVVDCGPVFENVVPGPEIDLLKFPVPLWSRLEAGRYIGTWHINVTRDPETGSRNVGVYRMEVKGPKLASVCTSPKSHLGQHFFKAERAGAPLEMAVAIGTSEAVVMAAGAGCPYGEDEYELAGGLQQEAVRLIRCGTVNLEVPADSEIVIEGIIRPGVRVQDGPYFDYAGAPDSSLAFLFEATRLLFRNNAIFRGTAIGLPGAEDQQIFSILSALGLFDFHGSWHKRVIQAPLIHWRLFRAFQFAGRVKGRSLLRRKN